MAGENASATPAIRREPLLSAERITKRFGTLNDDIDLDICGGEIHALLGENGAGKSTPRQDHLRLLQPTSGHLRAMVRVVVLASPASARALGLLMGGSASETADTVVRTDLSFEVPTGQIDRGGRDKPGDDV